MSMDGILHRLVGGGERKRRGLLIGMAFFFVMMVLKLFQSRYQAAMVPGVRYS